LTTPPFDDNPFRSPDHATPSAPMPAVPGQPGIPHWFTTKVKITLAVCVLLALGLGSLGALTIYWADRSGPLSDGDCLYLTSESGAGIAYHSVSCSSRSATYKVEDTYRGAATCAPGDYVRFRLDSGTGRTLCLALNVRSGDCLRGVDDKTAIAKVSCTDPEVQDRVRILTGFGREEDCDGADKVLTYAGPPSRTVCLAPPGEEI
jgi:hypothetical protein